MPLVDDLDLELEDPQNGIPIAYQLYHLVEDGYAGPSGGLGYESGSSKVVTYITPWETHSRFCQLMLGVNYTDMEGSNLRLFRSSPHAYPVYNYNNMWATAIQNVSGIPGPDPYEYVSGSSGEMIRRPTYGVVANDTSFGNQLKYAYAKVSVLYQPLPYVILPEEDVAYNQEWKRFTTIQRTPRVEFLQVTGGYMYWVDDPVKSSPDIVPHPTPIRDQSVDYVVTWHRVPFVIKDFDTYIGKANSKIEFLKGHVQAPTDGFGIDRMLLVGVQETLIPHPWTTGTFEQLYNYSFFFQDKFNGHNKALRRQGSGTGTTFNYNEFSFTGASPAAEDAGNPKRAIKHADMGLLFAARS